MKIYPILFTVFFSLSACQHSPTAIDPEHTSENAVDWVGTYRGILPCADCNGIDTVLILSADKHYQLTETYQGHPETFQQKGTFQWLKDGQRIQLDANGDNRQYFVGENRIWMLDSDGHKINGELSKHYQLEKTE
ncbi:copper resistance protein NlpE [Suttonella ornithocola]|nr:copper resistance protein NlpE [Suttonella ornithocola]